MPKRLTNLDFWKRNSIKIQLINDKETNLEFVDKKKWPIIELL